MFEWVQVDVFLYVQFKKSTQSLCSIDSTECLLHLCLNPYFGNTSTSSTTEYSQNIPSIEVRTISTAVTIYRRLRQPLEVRTISAIRKGRTWIQHKAHTLQCSTGYFLAFRSIFDRMLVCQSSFRDWVVSHRLVNNSARARVRRLSSSSRLEAASFLWTNR